MKRFTTIYDRADLYVPFIEKSLKVLAPGGTLGFICADRWMKNKYGRPLRQLIADGFHLRYYVDMKRYRALPVRGNRLSSSDHSHAGRPRVKPAWPTVPRLDTD